MKNIYWMDEIHPTNLEFKIDLDAQERYILKQYRPEQVFLVYFVGVRVICSWVFLNFVQILATLFELQWKGFIAIEHINSIGIAVEFHNQFNQCMVYADSWIAGEHSRVAITSWTKSKRETGSVAGKISMDSHSVSIKIGNSNATCETEHSYRFYKIKKSKILSVEISK